MTVNGQLATSGQARTVTLNDPSQPTTITIVVTAQNDNDENLHHYCESREIQQ